MSENSSINDYILFTKATRFRLRDINSLRDYLCIHRMNKFWMSAICLETSMFANLWVQDKIFFLLSTPQEIETLKNMSTERIFNMLNVKY